MPGHKLPAPIARAVWARDAHYCVYCLATKRLELEHVLSRKAGGKDFPSNLVISCAPCNLRKRNMPVDLFVIWMERLGYGHGSADAMLIRVGLHLARPCLVRARRPR